MQLHRYQTAIPEVLQCNTSGIVCFWLVSTRDIMISVSVIPGDNSSSGYLFFSLESAEAEL